MPLGVVAVVYEARPNVTIDAAALCLKSGNAIVLRGSSSAAHSNAALAQIASEAAVGGGAARGLRRASSPAAGARSSPSSRRSADSVDLIIPRGGEGLKEALQARRDRARDLRRLGQLPRLRRRRGADLEQAEAIVLNAKMQRPGVCNAAETLLVHATSRRRSCRASLRALGAARRRAARATSARWRSRGAGAARVALVEAASEEDWDDASTSRSMLAVGVVDSVERGDRAHRALRQRALGGDRHARHGRRARVPARRRRGLRLRQRLDALHRRRRVRDGRGDRQLDAEAARARADRAARAVHVQVPRRGRRTRPRLSAAATVAALGSLGILGGTFNPPHVGHLALARHARERARRSSASC